MDPSHVLVFGRFHNQEFAHGINEEQTYSSVKNGPYSFQDISFWNCVWEKGSADYGVKPALPELVYVSSNERRAQPVVLWDLP